MLTSLIQTNDAIPVDNPTIIVDVFKEGVPDTYQNKIFDYSALDPADQAIIQSFIDSVIANAQDPADSDCNANILNAPVFNGYSISAQIARNGVWTGFCACEFDYNTVDPANQQSITDFISFIQTEFGL